MIKACDDALAAQQKQIEARDSEIGHYEIMTKEQADNLAEKDRQLGAWYRSPYLWIAVGLGAGLYLGKK